MKIMQNENIFTFIWGKAIPIRAAAGMAIPDTNKNALKITQRKYIIIVMSILHYEFFAAKSTLNVSFCFVLEFEWWVMSDPHPFSLPLLNQNCSSPFVKIWKIIN